MSIVTRTCRELERDRSPGDGKPLRLDALRSIGAYVLLGAPGSGKTTLFEREARETGGVFESARDFITLSDRPEWRGRTLFIDALDERRAGSSNATHPLDQIRSKLDRLGRPRFRISCRDADWLRTSDQNHLMRVSPDRFVCVFHLDPLDQDGVFEILANSLGTQTPQQFVQEARDRGIERLLENPLTLKLLVHATESGGWPASRTETYERACAILSRETNPEHTAGNHNRPAESALLKVVGRLCAIQLLTGSDGYSLEPAQEGGHLIPFASVGEEASEAMRYALQSRLFVSVAGGMTPVHRHVAEFLAGRYLAGKVSTGTPVSRVLALVSGYDGHVVSDLQGTTAWLAAHSRESRASVMSRDPVGTLIYGDISAFSSEEKILLVRAVAQHLERHTGLKALFHGGNPRLSDLATPEMANSIRDTLRRSDEDSTNLRSTFLVLRALQVGRQVPRLADDVLRLVREQGRHHQVRSEALDAYVRQVKGSENNSNVLLGLLEEVWRGEIDDPEDELLGQLLATLYPEPLGAAQAVSYLRSPRNRQLGAAYWRFWNFNIAEETDIQRIAELLDAFADRAASIRHEFEGFGLGPICYTIRHLPPSLLARYLKSANSQVEPPRLYTWLKLVSDDRLYRPRPDERRTVQEWLEARPKIWKSVFLIVAEHSASDGRFDQVVDRAQHLLLNFPIPSDSDRWCLDQSRRTTDEGVVRVLMESARTIRRRNPSISVPGKSVTAGSELDRSFRRPFEEVLADDGQVKHSEQPSSSDEADPLEVPKREWRSRTRENLRSLRENRCQPAFLEGLAEVYFGNDYLTEGAGAQDRLFDLLGDEELVEAALAGLKGAVTRDDIPTDREVLKLHMQDRWHRLALPFLAGIEEIERSSSSVVDTFGESQLRLALAFHYTMRRQHPAPNGPESSEHGKTALPRWYLDLLESDPGLLADVLVQTMRSEIRKGLVLYSELLNLLQEGVYSEVARLVSLPLLRVIPVRCTVAQLDGLELILKAALLHCKDRDLQALTEEKLGRNSMTVGQRVYWLAAGLFLDPLQYRERLEQYVSFDEERIRHLVEFMAGDLSDSDDSLPIHSLDVQSLEALIARAGWLHRPLSQHTQAVRASALVQGFVEQLGSNPSSAATEALERLLRMRKLEPWRPVIRHWQRDQFEVRRNSSFSYPSIEQVRQSLDNLRPASAADLTALTTDLLEGLAREIRDGNASLWRQFWNEDSGRVATTPKHEDRCRDLLLQFLRDRGLERLGVDSQPEGRYADDKRADIRVSFGGFNTPIEIKKSIHRDLWSAIRNQLVRKYTRDPESDGYGIYLVLWFGAQNVPTPPSGLRPQNACELRERLRDVLEADERLKILIVVIDVADSDIG